MYNKKILLMLAAGIVSPVSEAGITNPTVSNHHAVPWVVTLSGGAVWAQKASDQTFYLTPAIEKTYAPKASMRALFSGDGFLGLQKTLTQTLQGQVGIAVGGASSAKINGEIWTDADPAFNNHSYNYKIQHAQVSLKGKLLKRVSHGLLPWISASLGVGINKASSFDNASLICGELTNPNYTSKTKNSFTYTLGAGLQKELNQHVQLGIGYEFADWGKSQLGRAPEQTLNSGLGLNHFYTNGLLLNLTYIA